MVTIANFLVELESRSKAMSELMGLVTETKSKKLPNSYRNVLTKRVDIAIRARRFVALNLPEGASLFRPTEMVSKIF